MSFILDALRKSDTERQQQEAPRAATSPQHTHTTKKSIWVPVLAIILALNIAALTWVCLKDPPADQASAAATEAAQADATIRSLRKEADPAAASPPADTAPPTPAVAAEPAVAVVNEPPVVAKSEPPPAPVVETRPEPKPVPAQEPKPEPEPESTSPGLPSFEQLVVGGILTMPQLRLDMHVYAGEPSRRFVFINMNKYREGDRIDEGPVVEEITPYGVILSHQGNRFTVERH